MRNIKLIVSYDGTDFCGWQIQQEVRTVQSVLEGAISKILASPTRVYASGRTDSGVHALNQVVCFKTKKDIDCKALKRGLNSLLPGDTRVHDVSDVAIDFDPRRSAISRRYRYLIVLGDVLYPFVRNYAWHIRDELYIEEMSRSGVMLIGSHDFSSFEGKGGEGEGGGNRIREVTDFGIIINSVPLRGVKETGERVVEIEIEANAFLRHMVRNIVGTLVDVGRGKTGRDEFFEILRARDRRRAGATAPPQGLYLVEVLYPES